MLGLLVVGATFALLGTGLALVLLGEPTSRQTLLTVLGQRIDTITLHQASFAVWAVVTGLHVLPACSPRGGSPDVPAHRSPVRDGVPWRCCPCSCSHWAAPTGSWPSRTGGATSVRGTSTAPTRPGIYELHRDPLVRPAHRRLVGSALSPPGLRRRGSPARTGPPAPGGTSRPAR